MNGRVYDPLVARFISADPILQDPMNGQSYNRYSYVLNNPTNLTDPTGFSACREEDCFRNDSIKRIFERIPNFGDDKDTSPTISAKQASTVTAKVGGDTATTTPNNKLPHTVWDDAKEALLINDVQRVYVTTKRLVRDTANYFGGDANERKAAGRSFRANWREYVGIGMMFATRGREPVNPRMAAPLAKAAPNFYVTSSGTVIPAVGYRAVGGPAVAEAMAGVVAPRNPTYITFDDITNMSGTQAQSILQLPRTPTHWVSFDTLQLSRDLTIPTGRWGTTAEFEPLTRSFPEWGAGGATQAITNSPIKTNGFGALRE